MPDSVGYGDRDWFSSSFKLFSFFLDFLSKLFIKILNSTGNSRKVLSRFTGMFYFCCIFSQLSLFWQQQKVRQVFHYTHWTFYTAIVGKITVYITRRNMLKWVLWHIQRNGYGGNSMINLGILRVSTCVVIHELKKIPVWIYGLLALLRKNTEMFHHKNIFCGYSLESARNQAICLCHKRTTKAQISLHIRAVWSVPLLFALLMVSNLKLLSPEFQDFG